MEKSYLKHAAEACLNNGERLLDDALMLEFSKPPATAFYLTIIAQEEFAKSFLLMLVYKGIIEWNQYIWRATRDHKCKQLLSMIMDFMNPDFDEFINRLNAIIEEGEAWKIPPNIADALNIFYHEKISRWQSNNWVWAEPPNYDNKAIKVSEGEIEKIKHDQIYIDICNKGSLIPKKVITTDTFYKERDRSMRLLYLVRDMLNQ
jgi:AbiV family abortive infection protein